MKSRAGPLSLFDVLLFATVVLVWGGSWIVVHYQVGAVAPEVSVVWRFLMAAPVMLIIAFLRGERIFYGLGDHVYFAALGWTIFAFNFTLFYYGAAHIPSGLLSVVFSLASIGNVALAAIVFKAPINMRVVAGGLIGAVGVAGLFYRAVIGTHLDSAALFGLVLCLGGTLSFCIGNMVSTASQRRGLPIFASTGWAMLYGCLLLGAIAVVRGEAFTVEWRASYLVGLLFLGFVGSVLGFTAYFTLLGRIGAGRAGYTTVMAPVVALAVSTLVENYQWSLPAAFGLVAVIVGNVLVLSAPRKT